MHPSDRGFTLVEVLVALAIFSIAVLGLIAAQTTSIRSSQALHIRAYGDIAADNVMVRSMIDPAQLELGFSRGSETIEGQDFLWTRNVRPSGRGEIVAITVDIRAPDSDQIIASLSGFRGNR